MTPSAGGKFADCLGGLKIVWDGVVRLHMDAFSFVLPYLVQYGIHRTISRSLSWRCCLLSTVSNVPFTRVKILADR